MADVEAAVWRAFVATWWEKFEDKEVGAGDLFPLALEADGLDLGNGQERSQKTRFGKLLGGQRDRVIGGYPVTPSRTLNRAQMWRLQTSEPMNVMNVNERFGTQSHAGEMNTLSENAPAVEQKTFIDVHNVHSPHPDEDPETAATHVEEDF
jgi:hypothetical protein